jgi:hypothetical protein
VPIITAVAGGPVLPIPPVLAGNIRCQASNSQQAGSDNQGKPENKVNSDTSTGINPTPASAQQDADTFGHDPYERDEGLGENDDERRESPPPLGQRGGNAADECNCDAYLEDPQEEFGHPHLLGRDMGRRGVDHRRHSIDAGESDKGEKSKPLVRSGYYFGNKRRAAAEQPPAARDSQVREQQS